MSSVRSVSSLWSGWNDESHVHHSTYRIFCFLTGVLSPAFGVIYQFTDPGAIDSLRARLGLALVALALLSLSYMSDWVKSHFVPLVHGLFYVLTAYFVGVTALNHFSPNYALGMLFAVTAIGVCFTLGLRQIKPLFFYLAAAITMCIAAVLVVERTQVSPAIVIVSSTSTGVVLIAVARSKLNAEAQASNTEKRYHTLLNAANDAIFIADPETNMIVEANEKAQQLIERPLDVIRRMRPSELFPPDKREQYSSLFEQHVYEEEPIPETLHVETRNGDSVPVDVSASLIEVDGKQLIQGIFRDATARQRHEQQLIEAKEHAEELLQLKSSFLNNMSHELRTPLTSILGYAEVLHEESDEGGREFAERIVNSAERLQNTLNSVLDLAQLESGKSELDFERIDVGEEVEEAASLLQPMADKKGLAFETRITGQAPYARVDVACLNRIINNLVGNAIKFTDEGRVTIEVGTTAQSVVLYIEDTGIGIEEDFLEHIFDEFRQESTGLQRSHEGNGLGLAITKQLVDLLGGTIEVQSEKGVGSVFAVYLPRADVEDPAEGASQPQNGAVTTDTTAPLNGTASSDGTEDAPPEASLGCVLIVEDNMLTRQLVSHQLSDSFRVETASSPEGALALARKHHFDLFLLDIHLGADQNGVDLLHDLRMLPAHDRVPAVALTAYALPNDRERFLEAGFDHYLSKPFTAKQLLSTIKEALHKHAIPKA